MFKKVRPKIEMQLHMYIFGYYLCLYFILYLSRLFFLPISYAFTSNMPALGTFLWLDFDL